MDHAMDLSRREFIQTTVGTVAALGLGSTLQASPVSDGLAFLTISELSELIRTKKISPVEITRLMLQRIDKFNPVLNAYITVTSEQAMKSAQDAEKEIQQGKWRGPLHGVPVALKDLFDTAGVRTTAASALFKDRVPEEDAEVVRKLKAAGAVLLGKLNMHEFAYGGSSTVSYFGAVHNPWERTHVTGGSSGGSAAAVAAGLCFGALGSDTGGSIRQPAAFCGIVGLKPTYGLVSTRGVIPLSWSLDHVGPMTRSVADAGLMLQAIAGYDQLEITSERMTVPNYMATLRSKTSSLRLGVPHEFFFESLDPEVEAVTNEALSVMRKLTASVEQVRTVPVNNITNLTVLAAEAYTYHADFVAKTPERYQKPTPVVIRAGADIRARDYILARREVERLRQEIRRTFESVDALVTPTSPVAPPSISTMDTAYSSPVNPDFSDIRRLTLRNTIPFDKYGTPTISVPCGFTRKGLPVGLQISGPHGGEAVVLQLAHAYEQATEWHKKHPTIA
jgi:aspartyl-tRNA(Asn)/glutamyl-tRNA(Gln) amidotransferase subunit A